MSIFVKKWDEIAFLILAFEAVAWLIAEIFLLRMIGYPVVILTLVLFFVHTLAGFKEASEAETQVPDRELQKV